MNVKIWIHVDTADALDAAQEVVDRLVAACPDIQPIFTTPQGSPLENEISIKIPPGAVGLAAAGSDIALCLWLCNETDNTLLSACHKIQLPVIMVCSDDAPTRARSWLWRHTRGRGALRQISQIFVTQPAFLNTFRSIGVSHHRLDLLGPFLTGGTSVSFLRSERDEFQSMLAVRPAIYATSTPLDEADLILRAFTTAQRGAHRALLILQPNSEDDVPAMLALCKGYGFKVAQRSIEGEPSETTQVFLADDVTETGLWFSLAGACVFGGTFSNTPTANPMHAAAAGSAIICGPKRAGHDAIFDRLLQGNAAKEVTNPAELGDTLRTFLASDIQAEYAHAAWLVLSEGAKAIDRVVSLIETLIPQKGEI